MSRISGLTFLSLQEAVEERMDGVDRGRRWRNLMERLGFKGIACCGAALGLLTSNVSVRDAAGDYGSDEEDRMRARHQQDQVEEGVPVGSGMNLAAALAAERNTAEAARASTGDGELEAAARRSSFCGTGAGTPGRVSLMALLEETECGDGGGGEAAGERKVGFDSACCVCMGRKKDAAFIPCGHTFCRLCSRELWFNRGTCPLCNRSILDILHIF